MVFVEGGTEEQYIRDWHRRHRNKVNIEVDPIRGVPLTLVTRAVAVQRTERREARRGRGRAHDQFWCVFDRDTHPNLPETFSLARSHEINVAFSNPCLELWFLLHFRNQTAFIDGHAVQRAAAEHLHCGKVLTEQALTELRANYPKAVERARALEVKHELDGSPAASNPSSGFWALTETICSA